MAIKTVTVEPLVPDDIQLRLPTRSVLLTIANVLPPDVDAPDWRTPEPPGDPRQPEYPLVAKARAALARVGIDLEKQEAARFERFLNTRFPVSKFAAFRSMVDGPDLAGMVARREGWETAPRSKVRNYWFIVRTRRTLRGAAEILAKIAAESGERLPGLRLCEFCDQVFIARRKDKDVCSDSCGSGVRMRRRRAKRRAKYKQYEHSRKVNDNRKHNRKLKGVAR
jgi:hypothetical protein